MANDKIIRQLNERLAALANKALSAALRYDLSRTDILKWVYFTREILAVILFCIMTLTVSTAFFSTRQVEKLLQNSVESQGRSIADAIARASFVPLALEDKSALEELVNSYRAIEHLGGLKIYDAQGSIVQQWLRDKPGAGLTPVTTPILSPEETWTIRTSAPQKPIGTVEVDMETAWIVSRVKRIALINIAVSGILALSIFLIGLLAVRILIERMRDLVGEARMANEVKRANAELESFSYSVAHDLRAPLRAMDGFSQMLMENYPDKLDEDGKDLIRRVRLASQRMGRLVDDLLSLSRVTRSVMNNRAVNLSALARTIAAELKQTQPERQAEFVIADGIWAHGDENLLRVALENLLGNAWKYTGRHAQARIEFGAQWRAREKVFFVQDDGAGFDMAFQNKLFKPFNRLHHPEDFEGTGIGLATVQRIIERHGGRIWGEGQVEKGATFYFTLSEK